MSSSINDILVGVQSTTGREVSALSLGTIDPLHPFDDATFTVAFGCCPIRE